MPVGLRALLLPPAAGSWIGKPINAAPAGERRESCQEHSMNARYVLVNPSALPMRVDVNRCVAGCERISILLPLGLLDERHMRDEAHCTVLADEVLQGLEDLVERAAIAVRDAASSTLGER
jgi:hypothetical protein